MHLKVLDCAAETINLHFAETTAFITEAIAGGGKVLVHWYVCGFSGVRCGTCVAAVWTW